MFRKLVRTYRNERRTLILIGILGVLTSGTEALALISIAPLVQAAAEGSETYQADWGPISVDLTLSQYALLSGGMLVTALLVQIFALYVTARLTTGYRLRARLAVIDAFQDADWSAQAMEREGWLRTLSTDNILQSSQGLRSLANWIKGAIGLTIFVAGAILVDPLAVVLIVGVLGLLSLALRPVNRLAGRISAATADLNLRSSEELATLTMTARELKIFGVVAPASKRFRYLAKTERKYQLKNQTLTGMTSPIFRSVGSLLIVALIAIAATREGGDVAATGLVALLLYRAFNYGSTLVSVHQSLVTLVPVLDQLDDGVERLRAARSRATERVPEGAQIEHLTIDHVTMRYPGASSDALHDVSAEFGAHEVIGIVGPSGAGKTTLAELLVGLRRPTSGTICYDGLELHSVTDDSRANLVTLVSQHVPLVPGSLVDNVRFFRDISEEAVDEALVGSGLESFVAELPDGRDTRIGPGARALSGGQMQRIGIARAIAGAPRFLVLDEPTSALDATTEKLVTDTIGALRGRIGVIVIAHRLTTLRHCDRVLVVEDGTISDIGSMRDLSERNEFVRHAVAVGSLSWAG